MKTVRGLPYPSLSPGRFSYALKQGGAGSIALLSDDALFGACGLRIAFSGREGGTSTGAWESLNLGLHVQDSDACVLANRARLMGALGAEGRPLLVPKQVHGTNLVEVEGADNVEAARAAAEAGADGLLVHCSGVAALLNFADCMPVILAAPGGSFAVLHAGWRGVYGHIVPKGLAALCAHAGCEPGECNAYLGPYIHAECFEVGLDLAEKFEAEFGAACRIDDRHICLGTAMRTDLAAAGMDEARIASANICTVCNSSEYFSYRASGGTCGRHGAIAIRLQ